MREPLIHSHILDVVPDDHPLAWVNVYCDGPMCGEMLHALNNECMQTWVETGAGNFCVKCLHEHIGNVFEDEYALPDEKGDI